MIKVLNLKNGEIVKVWNTDVNEQGEIVRNDGKDATARYLNSYPFLTLNGRDAEGRCRLTIAEGYEVLKGRAKAKKAEPAPEPEPEPTPSAVPNTPEPMPTEPAPEPVHIPAPATPTVNDEPSEDEALAAAAILKLLRQSKTAELDETKVRALVESILTEHESKPRIVKIQVNNAEPRELPDGQAPHPLLPLVLKMVANDRVISRWPWLYGPAGSGKSTLAKQVADALGLPFYSVSSLQQKYELEGYTDAVGEFVQTSFFKAMKEGGIFCFDEASTSTPEVQVAFNTVAAQLVYNFPKEGMTKAHPDFHIIAADNTTGRGGDKRYTARFQLDESTLDRYTPIKVDYTREQDLRMANGDENLVEFICEVRRVLEEASTTYLATPRAIRAISAFSAMEMSTEDAVWYGLCSGWKTQDIRTFAQCITCDNVYGRAFKKLAKKI